MPGLANQLKQTHKVRAGTLEVKLLTTEPLSTEELAEFGKIAEAAQAYVVKHPKEPGEVKKLRAVQAKTDG